MIVKPEHVGTCIAWDLGRDGAVIKRILSVCEGPYSPSISYEAVDGFDESIFPSMYFDLADITKDWRPATPEETAWFTKHYRPAPQNWY